MNNFPQKALKTMAPPALITLGVLGAGVAIDKDIQRQAEISQERKFVHDQLEKVIYTLHKHCQQTDKYTATCADETKINFRDYPEKLDYPIPSGFTVSAIQNSAGEYISYNWDRSGKIIFQDHKNYVVCNQVKQTLYCSENTFQVKLNPGDHPEHLAKFFQ